ncbi:hypothetical protein E2C01_044110 [Portunus trituberculatus]|uniref:Uncharacterized protein n=1 Tax=Portunus trituberculatus TaxID=210409 RepID=A0A5B7FXH9_PORTR|nr:hypothetical protein [Portunus trituberculatus]
MTSKRTQRGAAGSKTRHHKRQKKREKGRRTCARPGHQKLLENVSVVSNKTLETLKKRDPNPARSSKVAHDVEESVKIYQEIFNEKNKKKQTVLHLLYSFFKPVRHAVPVTPADPATAGPSTSAADGSTACPSSISLFFKPVKRAEPTKAGPSTYTSDNADDNILPLSAH